jgi:hypothetical protein
MWTTIDLGEKSKRSEVYYPFIKDQLLPYLKYKDKNEAVECSICSTTFPEKDDLFRHLNSIHKNEIMEKLDSESRKKRFKRSDEHISKMMDIVKSQCGSHSVKVYIIQVGSRNNFRLAGWNLGSRCIEPYHVTLLNLPFPYLHF